MSLFVAIFYWVVIPALVFLIARWLFRRSTTLFQRRAVVAGSMAVFLGLLWLAAGEKWWLDYQVRELCAKDGGVKVYESVKLPAERFNQWGQVNFYKPTQGENSLGAEYIYKSEDYYYRQGNPMLVRYRHQIIRRSDGKLLGETASYGRGGGDLPGPWEPSNFHCPPTSESSEVALFKKVFVPIN